ncbi:hypothetical protein [Peribacillus simplex]
MKISYEGVSNKESTLIKTESILVEGEGWKVDQVEIIGGVEENH